MFIKIDFTSDMPIYEQIKNQIIEGIARGELQNGDSLPSIRDLASEIGVNMHTVAKAYNELKDMGLIAVNKKHGAYIAVSKGYDKEFLNEMMEELTPIVAKAICKGMNKNELIRLIETIFDSFGEGKMSEKLLIFILSFPAQIFLVLLCFFIPYFSREHILFGVNVPPTIKKSEVTKKFYKEYWRNFALTVLIPTLLFFYILFESTERVLIKYNILYPLFVIVLMTLNHYVIYRKVLKAKKKGNWQEGKKQIVVVPIKKDKKGGYPSRLWFLVPIGVFIGLLIITVVRYNQLPKIIPLHYNQKLEVDYSGPKSELIKPLSMMFGSMLLAQGLGYFVYELTKKGKMKLSIYFPEKSAEQNEKVKNYTAYFLIWILVLIELIMGLVIFSMLDIINIQTTLALLPVFLIFPLITLGYYLIKVFNINSERLSLTPEEKISEKIIDRDDDKYWIAGMFYYNPDDPALFVERRVGGFGWDLNYAKPLGKFIGFLIIVILVAVVVVSLVLI